MSFGVDKQSGVTMAFVTRRIEGDVFTTVAKYDKKTKEVIKSEKKVKNPVIVFFPSKTCVVLPEVEAEAKGFLKMPNLINFEHVNDTDTLAGQFKFAIDPQKRKDLWQKMEDEIVHGLLAVRGLPLQKGVSYSEKSILTETEEKEAA